MGRSWEGTATSDGEEHVDNRSDQMDQDAASDDNDEDNRHDDDDDERRSKKSKKKRVHVMSKSGQTEKDRRVLRHKQRELHNDIAIGTSNNDIDYDDDAKVDEFQKIRNLNNHLWEEVRYTREAVLDSENMDLIAGKAARQAESIVQVSSVTGHVVVADVVEVAAYCGTNVYQCISIPPFITGPTLRRHPSSPKPVQKSIHTQPLRIHLLCMERRRLPSRRMLQLPSHTRLLSVRSS